MKTYNKFLINNFKTYCTVFMLTCFLMLPSKSNADWQITSAVSHFYEDVMTDGTNLFAASSNSGVFKSTDMGNTWAAFNNGLSGDGLRCYEIIFSQNKLIMATVDGIYISDNNVSNWVKKSTGLPIGGGSNNIFAFTVYDDAGVYLAGTWNGIFRSTDNCETWLPTSMNGGFNGTVCFTRFNNILFAGRDMVSSGYLYKSTNGGVNESHPLSAFKQLQ